MKHENTKLINLVKTLIFKRSITPEDDGVMEVLTNFLQNLAFTNQIQAFTSIISSAKADEKRESVLNLYSYKKFAEGKNLCFAGHVDVVHPGKEYKWTYPAFEPTIENGILYGRGVSDMKAAIACFCIALEELLTEGFKPAGTISFLITGDEEGSGENGTKKMLEFITAANIKISDCLVGEPTNPEIMGTVIKIGRRGSIGFELKIEGQQGHLAYPENFLNPIEAMAQVVLALKAHKFDTGNEFFEPTNLEFFKIEADNIASNVVSQTATCGFNVRFNNLHIGDDVKYAVENIIKNTIAALNISNAKANFCYKYFLKSSLSGNSFLTDSNLLSIKAMQDAIFSICNIAPVLSTTGGTSDARFIKNYANTLEFGMISKTAHQIDEHEKVEDIITLKNIYKQFIQNYFQD